MQVEWVKKSFDMGTQIGLMARAALPCGHVLIHGARFPAARPDLEPQAKQAVLKWLTRRLPTGDKPHNCDEFDIAAVTARLKE